MSKIPGQDLQEANYQQLRQQMVERQLKPRGIKNKKVIEVMSRVPRHKFVPDILSHRAYEDGPLPIGMSQTISQPYIVAAMTEVLDLKKDDKVLEIGSGSGYQAAVLAELVKEVFSIEIISKLHKIAEKRLFNLGYKNIKLRLGDGYKGWPTEAPFEAIIITAAPPKIPQPLLQQLALGGKMVLPLGSSSLQKLLLIEKTATGFKKKEIFPVRFVPMTGEVRKGIDD